MTEDEIRAVEAILTPLAREDDALAAAAADTGVTAPGIQVRPELGRLLHILACACGARRVLEFGTLAGYSTIWLARAVGPQGRVVSLELERDNASRARGHLEKAGVSAWVDILVGPASKTSSVLVELNVEPFDLVFIDADKASYPLYLARAMSLTKPGSLIVMDNVVRGGGIVDPQDDNARGALRALAQADADPRVEVAALQTVSSNGWDGFAILRRVDGA